MATFIVGGVVLVIIGGIVWKMVADRKNGKNSYGGDCAHCRADCGAKSR